ncbi:MULTISPECIES: hypothetical protein [Bacillaceae]|uniref:Uncharacterized protein n=1 Tax=Oceanobacillus caeni TaxID=405946 RepID=A0ABR5MFB5_9BACI|nr:MULTISPECIES: hypothetical protein [Bacillaceae]KPH69844.1 hypothetical protein AFL42_16890 [Oceanobacillus caeni]HAJ4038286.1 hypothetical protein [Escherichia coli]
MDIKVTNVDVAYIKEIDRKAEEVSKKIGRKFSRNEYIKMLIQNDAELRLIKIKEQKFDEAIKNLSVTLRRQENKLQEFINSNNRLFHLMASGEILEGDEYND